MGILRRILGRDTRFYDLLEGSAVEAKNSATMLARLIPKAGAAIESDMLGEVAQIRRKHKRISQETVEELCRNFVTPLEREDIESLSSALYKITKNIEKVAERLMIAPARAEFSVLDQQIALLEKAAAVVVEMVNGLRAKRHGEAIKDSYERIQSLEGDADKLMNQLLRELYHGGFEPHVVVYWKDLFELLEKAVDRCRDVGSVVFHVALKYS